MVRFFPRSARSFVLACTALVAASLSAQQPSAPNSLPPVTPAGRPAIGLALEGGGALGLAHIGILQWFEDNHIPVDRLAGTSMGSLVGALYASGTTPAQLRAIATGNAFESVFTFQVSYADSSFRRRQDRREIPAALSLGMRRHPMLRNALLGDRGVNEFLAAYMPAYNTAALDFDSLPIPFRCVATDLNTLGPVVFSSGTLPFAVRASISIPGVFTPVLDSRGHSLVDGGIMNNLPADVVRRDLHAGIVIAVHLDDGGPVAGVDTSSIVSVLNRAFSAGIAQNVQASMQQADLVLIVPVQKYSGTDYDKGGQLIREGYLAAEHNRPALMKYALDPSAWNAYLAARQSRLRPQPGILRAVRIEGGDPSAQESARADIEALKGKPITPVSAQNALKPIQSNGGYQANYQTFLSQPSTFALPQPDDGILVRLTKDTIGPPYLLFAPEFEASTSNPLRLVFNFRLIDQNLGGFGSELRANAHVGTRNGISAEYYRLFSPRGWFVQPVAGFGRDPVYIWSGQKRIAERSRQNLYGGFDFGRTFSNTTQIAAEWRAQNTRWSLVTGAGGGPNLSGAAQTAMLHYTVDHAQAGVVSPRGWRLSAAAGAFYYGERSANAPLAQLTFNRSYLLGAKDILGFSGEANSYFRRNVAQPWRFAIGGPMRLSAASFEEFRGTDTYLARAAFLRRIAALPTGLGQGLYATVGYEAGEVWFPEQRAILRQDGSFALIGNTPIGLITFGVSVGDAGHRKVFLSVGRWF